MQLFQPLHNTCLRLSLNLIKKRNEIIFDNPNIDRCFEMIIEHINNYYKDDKQT